MASFDGIGWMGIVGRVDVFSSGYLYALSVERSNRINYGATRRMKQSVTNNNKNKYCSRLKTLPTLTALNYINDVLKGRSIVLLDSTNSKSESVDSKKICRF